MPIVIRILVAIDLLLVAIEHLFPGNTQPVLPLGGSEFIQLAVLLLVGVAAHELFSTRKRRRK